MKRLTTDTPKDNLEAALNLFYIKDHETWVRGGGPGPEYADVSLFSFIRDVVKTHIPDVELPEDDDDLSNMMPEWLMDGIDSAEGIVALLYTAAWAYAELRHKLMRYEDTGLTPEEIRNALDVNDIIPEINVTVDHIRDLLKAEQDGRLLELPFVAMVEQSLQDGKMKPMGDQKHNGRYAVVYVDHNKWKSPLIDICGKPYDREEAEARMAALAGKGGTHEADPV